MTVTCPKCKTELTMKTHTRPFTYCGHCGFMIPLKPGQKGFTVIELVICVAGVIAVVIAIGGGIAAYHFVMKFW